ncbi:hypothetical protein CASFOL_013041 [Castilleja foliolosa]|uniref:F-box domain-containing protein n=1 Tax=Castilleja foliolosa TaxID=1961234 RepID=A0ABD3DKP0_9LAMI
MKKQAIDSEGSMDRISELPQPLLHDILCFLSQKEAVQTSVLSKSWRYLGSTRPNLHFHQRLFDGDEPTLRYVLDKTLQRYHDQKLQIKEFCLTMSGFDHTESISFLKKWVPIVILNVGLQSFSLKFLCKYHNEFFKLPHVFFESETLQRLSLHGCKLTQTPVNSVILCKHLQRLFLDRVYIADKTLNMIFSSCGLIETLVLHRCRGLRTIKFDDRIRLKLFDFENNDMVRRHDDPIIEINSPTLETVKILSFPSWFNHHKYLVPHLKSLYLESMQLPSRAFDSFSSNFPSLEELSLIYCHGFEELQLSSRSLKNFIISWCGGNPLKAVIDAPSLVVFEYRGQNIPQSISFQATASEWESEIVVSCDMTVDDSVASVWCLELYEILKALSKSKISLCIIQNFVANVEDIKEEEETYGGLCEPVVVERLVLSSESRPNPSSVFLKNLKRICLARN